MANCGCSTRTHLINGFRKPQLAYWYSRGRRLQEHTLNVLGSVPLLGCGQWDRARCAAESLSSRLFAADVDGRTPLVIRLGFPKHLVGDRRGVSLPEQHIAEQVHDGVALGPAKVAMWLLAGRVA
jgi:hypothetical protein